MTSEKEEAEYWDWLNGGRERDANLRAKARAWQYGLAIAACCCGIVMFVVIIDQLTRL